MKQVATKLMSMKREGTTPTEAKRINGQTKGNNMKLIAYPLRLRGGVRILGPLRRMIGKRSVCQVKLHDRGK